jgi:hypothetical protein
VACAWCGRPYTPRTTGGHAQRFCRSTCRRAFDAAGRRWVADAIAAGVLTVGTIRNGGAATRALLAGAISPAPVPEEARKLTSEPVLPAQRPGEEAELLSALLAVPSEGWHALAAAMSEELFDRLKRWQAARLANNRPQFRTGTP